MNFRRMQTSGYAAGLRRSSAARRLAAVSGFDRKSSMPTAKQWARSSSMALAVSAMIGTRSPRARSCRVASKPSSPACGVHQHDVEPLPIQAGQCRAAIVGDHHAVAIAFQHGDGDRGVDGVVFGEEDIEAVDGRHGASDRAGR